MTSVFKLESSRTIPRARALANPQDIYQVSKGQFTEMGPIYSQFTNLEKLTLDDNNYGHASQTDINALPQTITALTVISRGMDNMDLLYNRLPNIERLEVRYAKNPVSDAISNLKNIKYLVVWWDTTDSPTFSDALSACSMLESMEIHTKKPVDLSGVLTYMPNLRELKISTLCPSSKKQVPSVIFPDNMHEFPMTLECLDIHTKHNIVKLPTQVSILPNLKLLRICDSMLCNTQILNNIDCVPNLVELYLSNIDSPESTAINTNILHDIENLYIGHTNYKGFNKVRLQNPNFECNPNLNHLTLMGDCTQDFDNFPVSLSACKHLHYITFPKTNCRIIIPDEITRLPNLQLISVANSYDIVYMPHPDKWPLIVNSHYGASGCIIYSFADGTSTNLKITYYSRMSPDCKCRNPYYYLNKLIYCCVLEDDIKCTCAQPGLRDKHTGQILTFPPDMTANTPDIATYRAQIDDYIQRHQFTYPDTHPLLPPEPVADATTAVP